MPTAVVETKQVTRTSEVVAVTELVVVDGNGGMSGAISQEVAALVSIERCA